MNPKNPEASRYTVPQSDLAVYLIEDRRMEVSRWGRGNSKIGRDVYTYSKLPGKEQTCPGATPLCERVCYAKRAAEQNEPLRELWQKNTYAVGDLPPLPEDAAIVRAHISGDFDTVGYIRAWVRLAKARPEVNFFAYTRSWRVPVLLSALEELRALPNVQLFASVDVDSELPPAGWRMAWLGEDPRHKVRKLAIVCPEATGRHKDCQSCKYCFVGQKGDVIFPEH